jgi:hypothetical protein
VVAKPSEIVLDGLEPFLRERVTLLCLKGPHTYPFGWGCYLP